MQGTAVSDTFTEMQQVIIEHGPIRFDLWVGENGDMRASGIRRAFGDLKFSERLMLQAYEVLKTTHSINVVERPRGGGYFAVTISAA